jgi:hypothetical protein
MNDRCLLQQVGRMWSRMSEDDERASLCGEVH